MWIIQIIAWTNISIIGYNIGYPLLNYMLIAMDGVWEFFGVFFFALFALYLEFCVIVGNFKWGLRIPWLIELHAMKHANTLVNSFLVNVEYVSSCCCLFLTLLRLLLVASLAVTQFCARSFSVYIRVTSGNSTLMLINNDSSCRYLRGCSWCSSRPEMGVVCIWVDLAGFRFHHIALFHVPPKRQRKGLSSHPFRSGLLGIHL